MEFAVEKIGNVALVMLPVEELDAGNAGEFKRDVAPLLEQNPSIVFDLGKLRFIDSSGLGAFLSCLRKAKATGGDVKLCCASSQVRTVFELVRLHRILDILNTREAAVAAFASPGARTSA
jgi:anti-sigma B factor antagonist